MLSPPSSLPLHSLISCHSLITPAGCLGWVRALPTSVAPVLGSWLETLPFVQEGAGYFYPLFLLPGLVGLRNPSHS